MCVYSSCFPNIVQLWFILHTQLILVFICRKQRSVILLPPLVRGPIQLQFTALLCSQARVVGLRVEEAEAAATNSTHWLHYIKEAGE